MDERDGTLDVLEARYSYRICVMTLNCSHYVLRLRVDSRMNERHLTLNWVSAFFCLHSPTMAIEFVMSSVVDV
jgi:hypothetical protein